MASLLASTPLSVPVLLPLASGQPMRLLSKGVPIVGGLRLHKKIQHKGGQKKNSPLLKTKISCSIAQPETLQIVLSTIAKQLSIEETAVTPQTKFSDLGADSLDTVEIMMALEETFTVSIGEDGVQNLTTVQDAADLIEKVKAEAA